VIDIYIILTHSFISFCNYRMEQHYGAFPFPSGEEKCLSRGQRLTDRMMDYMALAIQKTLDDGTRSIHIIPSFITVGLSVFPCDDDVYNTFDFVILIMNQNDHWFLLIYEPAMSKFHLLDTVESEEYSPIDFQLLPIGDHDIVEDYYGQIPHQSGSATNCGILTLINLSRFIADKPLVYDGSPARINGIIRPFLSSILPTLKKSRIINNLTLLLE